MYESQRPFRELYESLLAYEGRSVSDEVLGPWLARNGAERTWLRELGAHPGKPWPTMSDEDLCCFVRTRKADDDLWPYDDTLTLSL